MNKGKGNRLMYVGQKAIIEKDGEVLVLFEKNIGLDFPGGKLHESDVNITESLIREVREETGLDIIIGEPFYTWLVKFPPHGEYDINDVFLVAYRCIYVGGEVQLSSEHGRYQWVNRDNFKEVKDDRPHFKALEKYFETG